MIAKARGFPRRRLCEIGLDEIDRRTEGVSKLMLARCVIRYLFPIAVPRNSVQQENLAGRIGDA